MTTRTKKRIRRAQFHQTRRSNPTLVAGGMLVIYLVAVYFAVPNELPRFFQMVAGFVNALLATVFAMLAVREFGGQLNRVFWPQLGLSGRSVIGLVVFSLVIAWWLSDWAPIQPVESAPYTPPSFLQSR